MPASSTTAASGDALLERLVAAVDEALSCDLDDLSEPALRRQLRVFEDVKRRVHARQVRISGTLADRCRRVADERDPHDRRASERAEQDLRRGLTDDLNWSPSEAKEATRVGRRLRDEPEVGEAFDAGRIPPANARLLTETLALLTGEARAKAERILLEAAKREDPVTFGRTSRRVLAELDHDTAAESEAQRHARRRAAVTQSPDGMTVLSGQWSGVDGEIVRTAAKAFSRPDRPGEHRTPEQRSADAIVEALSAALRAGEAPATHGVRPHVMVTIDYHTLLAGAGVAELGWNGPVPFAGVRRLLADAGVSRLLTDPDGLPLEAGEEVRTVPTGLYRTLLIRDGGCIAEGCDAPAAWTDVMHLGDAYRFNGRLRPDNAALGCRRHHRLYDLHGWRVDWEDGRPILRPPRRPSAGP